MDETARRPGGLTALAVFNFIFAGFMALGIVGVIVILSMPKEELLKHSANDEDRAKLEKALDDPNFMTMQKISAGVLGLATVLFIASGVGYLKQKRWGKIIGNVGGLIGVGLAVWSAVKGEANSGTMITAIYPVLTLLLLNTTFKDDFRA